mmetsp:Transcript_17604/g.48871  ORF Transcript_17604/g.48871 Transcript_17604/m.48871 type:complete len:98 (-) Transcript_17604:28-321(-)
MPQPPTNAENWPLWLCGFVSPDAHADPHNDEGACTDIARISRKQAVALVAAVTADVLTLLRDAVVNARPEKRFAISFMTETEGSPPLAECTGLYDRR